MFASNSFHASNKLHTNSRNAKKKESHKIQRTELMRHQYAMQP